MEQKLAGAREALRVPDPVEVGEHARGLRDVQGRLDLGELTAVEPGLAVAAEEGVPDFVGVRLRPAVLVGVRIPVGQARVISDPEARDRLVPVNEHEPAPAAGHAAAENAVLRRAVHM